jgi:hypothetical protein
MVGTKNKVPMLGVKLRDPLNLLWIFFFGLGYCGCGGRYWLLLQFFKVSLSIISLKDQIMDLFLKELNDGVSLSDYMITLVDLILSMKDGLIPCCDDLILLSHQGSKLVNLSDLSISLPIVISHGIDQLTHLAT